MQLHPVLGIERRQPVEVLVVANTLLDGELLDIGGRIRDTRAKVAGVPRGEPDLRGELGHRGARQQDGRLVDRLDQFASGRETVIHDRKAVQERALQTLRFVHAILGRSELLVAGIAVGSRGHDVGKPVPIERDHQRLLHRECREPTPRLGEAASFRVRPAHRDGELLMGWQCAMKGDGRVEIHLRSGLPAGEIRRAHPVKDLSGNGGFGETWRGDLRARDIVHDVASFPTNRRLPLARSNAATGSTCAKRPAAYNR